MNPSKNTTNIFCLHRHIRLQSDLSQQLSQSARSVRARCDTACRSQCGQSVAGRAMLGSLRVSVV